MAGTYTNLLTHIVFSTRHREPMIHGAFETEMYAYFGGVIKGERGRLLAANGMPDHVHLLALLSPALSLSDLMQKIKGNASKWINEQHKVRGHFAWQKGYGAFAVSESQKPGVTDYIANQKDHHRVVSFKEEFLALLEKHNVTYDEQYLWD